MGSDQQPEWATLPEPIVTHVMSFLAVGERCKMSSVCKNWNRSLDAPVLWKVLNLGFFFPHHHNLLVCIEKYGFYVRHLTITLNQGSPDNRTNATSAIQCFTDLNNLHLTHFKICFKGQNPLFYSGREFLVALRNLFEKVGTGPWAYKFKHLNLCELPADIDDAFITSISPNCKNLEYFNILNQTLMCNVSPSCMKMLVEGCKNLSILHIYHTSMSDSVLEALSQPNRTPLKRLGMVCRRQEKYGEDLSSNAWSNLLAANPDLWVELGFDHTIPLNKVTEIMKPEIPVQELHLATFTIIHHEVNLATSYYEDSLEKLVVQTRPSRELDEALLNLARRCGKLRSLLVYCTVGKVVIEEILSLHPVMKKKGSYILKSEVQLEPWTVGKEEGD